MRVSIIGGSVVDDDTYETAYRVGTLVARRGHTIVCGGLGGVMEAACRGAREADVESTTLGILPGDDREAANEWVTTPIATGLGHARNALVVMNGDAVIAIDGAAGTLSELGLALVFDRPTAGVDTHAVELDGFEAVDTPTEALDYVESAVDARRQ